MKLLLYIILLASFRLYAQHESIQNAIEHINPISLASYSTNTLDIQNLPLIKTDYNIPVLAVERGIKLIDLSTEKEVFIKEGKRIRIKIKEGKKINGRFTIVDQEHIKIRDTIIATEDILKIKKNPLWNYLLNAFVFYAPASVVLIYILLATLYADGAALFLPLLPIAGYLYGVFTINMLRGYRPGEMIQLQIIAP